MEAVFKQYINNTEQISRAKIVCVSSIQLVNECIQKPRFIVHEHPTNPNNVWSTATCIKAKSDWLLGLQESDLKNSDLRPPKNSDHQGALKTQIP